MLVDGKKTTLYARSSALQWAGLGVDLVFVFSTQEQCEQHLYTGAKMLLCSARGKVDA